MEWYGLLLIWKETVFRFIATCKKTNGFLYSQYANLEHDDMRHLAD